MKPLHPARPFTPRAAVALAAALAATACTEPAPDQPVASAEQAAVAADGSITPISQLPLLENITTVPVLGELLAKQTAGGETTALHVQLPPPSRRELAQSLVRIIGDVSEPIVLFNSDALVRLGAISKSPGPDFFTAFANLAPAELDALKEKQAELTAGAFGRTTNESVVFSGRSAVGRTVNPAISGDAFRAIGTPVPIRGCAVRPVSTLQAWGQSLFINSPSVVLDPARTWDPCTGAGTQGGVWTFAHLMSEMSIGSALSPSDFVTNWLSNWLNNYTVNGDVVLARTQMFNQVIAPWAVASGVVATLVTNPTTGVRSVTLSGPLNLNIAPFRLDAIVNRIDLGATATGGGGYGGTSTSLPVTAGELRFIFNVVQPNPWGAGTEATCGRKLFTTILEYGVPGRGCLAVVNWARKWSQLGAMPGFTAAYLAQLESMTESVVRNGAAPGKGNNNAINQIRTNEIALAGPWELREFTLTNEVPGAPLPASNLPINGPLRTHTVAQTPNDGAYSAAGADPTINPFVNGPVTAGLALPVVIPNRCDSSYTVPFFAGVGPTPAAPFRGGNALVGPGHWLANAAPATPNGICARHTFSLNTCQGCHRNDSGTNGLGGSTNFTHIDPLTPIPVKLSHFLTGGGPGMVFNVNDTQFAGVVWPFADLERRLQRLFDLSHCTSCLTVRPSTPAFIDRAIAIGPVPIDSDPLSRAVLKIGPVTDLATVQKFLDLRGTTLGEARSEPADFLRPIQAFAE